MLPRHLVLQNKSVAAISFADVTRTAQALQTQLDRDFTPLWGVSATVTPLQQGAIVPAHTWPMYIVNQPSAGLGVHLDHNGKPFAEIQDTADWSITASHEMLEMLVDPLGHNFKQAPDIDPASDGHLVNYLVEVGDPCEVFSYQINGVSVSDFITPEFYDMHAPAGTHYDFLARLAKAMDCPAGCYISWQDPADGRWHQKRPNGQFVTAMQQINPHKNPRDDRDHAFGDAEANSRHDLASILQAAAK